MCWCLLSYVYSVCCTYGPSRSGTPTPCSFYVVITNAGIWQTISRSNWNASTSTLNGCMMPVWRAFAHCPWLRLWTSNFSASMVVWVLSCRRWTIWNPYVWFGVSHPFPSLWSSDTRQVVDQPTVGFLSGQSVQGTPYSWSDVWYSVGGSFRRLWQREITRRICAQPCSRLFLFLQVGYLIYTRIKSAVLVADN